MGKEKNLLRVSSRGRVIYFRLEPHGDRYVDVLQVQAATFPISLTSHTDLSHELVSQALHISSHNTSTIGRTFNNIRENLPLVKTMLFSELGEDQRKFLRSRLSPLDQAGILQCTLRTQG